MNHAVNEPTLDVTPLHRWHVDAGARMAPFAGYEMPIQYQGVVAEHQACRSAAALFDVSHMGRLRFDGEGAEALLDRLLTRRISGMPVGAVRYGLICNEAGGVLDDVLVSLLETPSGSRYHLMVVNASNRAKIYRWIESQLADFPDVTLSDRTSLTAMIAVQGPLAVATVSRLFRADIGRLKRYRSLVTDQFGKPVIVSRTGYTGEDGLELIVRAEEALRVWENLMLAGREAGFCAAGLGARDTLRLEAGLPLYGHELDEQTDPITAGLQFACTLDGRDFIGAAALESIVQQGPQQRRIGLLPEGKRPVREDCSVVSDDGTVVGRVTSGAPSPTLGRPIAMALVNVECLDAGGNARLPLSIDNRGKRQAADVVPLPFYRPRPAT